MIAVRSRSRAVAQGVVVLIILWGGLRERLKKKRLWRGRGRHNGLVRRGVRGVEVGRKMAPHLPKIQSPALPSPSPSLPPRENAASSFQKYPSTNSLAISNKKTKLLIISTIIAMTPKLQVGSRLSQVVLQCRSVRDLARFERAEKTCLSAPTTIMKSAKR